MVLFDEYSDAARCRRGSVAEEGAAAMRTMSLPQLKQLCCKLHLTDLSDATPATSLTRH